MAIPSCPGEEQSLSDISAGRQGGRFFPMGWQLPPYFQNTPLPKIPPSWARGVSSCPHPFLFLLRPRPGNGTELGGGGHTLTVSGGPGSSRHSSLAFLVHLLSQASVVIFLHPKHSHDFIPSTSELPPGPSKCFQTLPGLCMLSNPTWSVHA